MNQSSLADVVATVERSSGDHVSAAIRVVGALSASDVDSLLEQSSGAVVAITAPSWEVLKAAWSRRFKRRESDWEEAVAAAVWLGSAGATLDQAMSLAQRFAWDTQGENFLPQARDWSEALQRAPGDWYPPDVFLLCLYCFRRRFLFQFKGISDVLAQFRGEGLEDYRRIPWMKAMKALMLLGGRQDLPGASAEALALIGEVEAETRDKAGRHAALDTCIQALDAAKHPSAEMLPETVVSICTGHGSTQFERDHVFLYRLARAYERLAQRPDQSADDARYWFGKALSTVQKCSDSLSGDREFTRFFAEQVRSERESIIRSAESVNRWDEAERDLRAIESSVKAEAHSTSIRSTEVLALFSSAVAFAVGAAAIGSNARSGWVAAVSGLLLMLGLVGFATLLIFSSRLTMSLVESGRDNRLREQRPVAPQLNAGWLALLAVGISVAALVMSMLIPKIIQDDSRQVVPTPSATPEQA